jgi:hypothetical protein
VKKHVNEALERHKTRVPQRLRRALTLLLATVLTHCSAPDPTPPDQLGTHSLAFSTDEPDVVFDLLESAAGWTSRNTLALDTSDRKEGAASLRSSGSEIDRFRRNNVVPVDVRNMRYLTFGTTSTMRARSTPPGTHKSKSAATTP